MCLEVSKNFGQCAAHTLLVNLGNLTAYGNLTLRTISLYKLLQRLDQAERRFIEHYGAGFILKRVDARLAALLLRQESLKQEPVARQTRVNQRRNECRSARQALNSSALNAVGSSRDEQSC